MTSLESIYEIKEAVMEPLKYLHSKDPVVFRKAKLKYERLVDVFFSGNKNIETTKQHQGCLTDHGFFINLLDEAVEYYYFSLEG